ncbi:MAG TPA: non-homologous end-joining DNA ligase [Acidobacteriota bacterium]|nr:non-homologous end-joining DNA ligase [Acidobacteriota bacterium]
MEPMKAKIGDETILRNPDYIFEPKLDGYRMICLKEGSKLSFFSRTKKDWSQQFPEFDFADDIKAKETILDGEVIVLDQRGHPSFQLLQQRDENKKKAIYVVFDILIKDGKDLRRLPILERKKILAKTIRQSKHLKFGEFSDDGQKIWQHAKKHQLEGVMAKQRASIYEHARSASWLKVKKLRTIDCVIIGVTRMKRSVSSLALGVYEDKNLRYIGKVGTGFDEAMISHLNKILIEQKHDVNMERGIIPVKPVHVCEIEFLHVTQDKRLRAPVFLRLRDDKKPQECTADQLQVEQPLADYKKKRDFSKTSEPTPDMQPKANKKLTYVIQKHDATRLHYDFRLEWKGVLKSWAVPKGISQNPADKRLAVMVEDHPLKYGKFHGTIPKGNYGAGTVEIWDEGHYVNVTIKDDKVLPFDECIKEGHLKIYLKGKRLEGTFTLTRMKDNNWIIIKKRDDDEIYGDAPATQKSITINKKTIELTNTQKEIEPAITKRELIEYYRKVAEFMLPHVKDRAISMMRFPNGPTGKKFFQKDTPDYFPAWFKRHDIQHSKSTTSYPVVTDVADIIYLANQVVETHIMASRVKALNKPDKLIFDLDPSVTDIATLKKMATYVGEFLKSIGLKPFIMTTGGKGYHVCVPIKPELDNDAVRDFALKIANVLAKSKPDVLTTELIKTKRKNRIFIDVNRLSSMQTSIAPYSVRARPGLSIACPFEWNELPNIEPDSITIKNPPTTDAWEDFFKNAVSLKKIIAKLK